MAAVTASALGARSTTLRSGYHGIDGLLYHDLTSRFVVPEAKGGTGTLAPGQMMDKWIESRLSRLAGRNQLDTPDRRALRTAIARRHAMWALVVRTNLLASRHQYAAQLQTYRGINSWGSPLG